MKIGKAERYVVLTVLFFFQPVIERYLSIFKYFDEIVVLAFFAKYLLKVCNTYKSKSSLARSLILGLCALTVVGLIGNTISIANQPIGAILQDIFSNCKLFLFIIAVRVINFTDYQQKRYKNEMAFFIRSLFTVMFACAVISLTVNIGMTDFTEGTRYGLRAFRFIYYNPAGLNTYFYLFMIIHSITMYNDGLLRKNTTLYTIMGVIAWMLTLRSRAIAFAVIYICLYFYIVYLKRKKDKIKFSWGKVILTVAVTGTLCWDAVEKYFISNEKASRYQLLHRSFDIAKDYFPIGTGFGTFGSEASRKYYSPIYYEYNMSHIFGLSPSNPLYIVDQFWFGILGQFGYIGLFLVGFMIFLIYKEIWKVSKNNKGLQLAALTLFFTSLFASLTAGSFIQASIIPSVMVFYILKTTTSARKIYGHMTFQNVKDNREVYGRKYTK